MYCCPGKVARWIDHFNSGARSFGHWLSSTAIYWPENTVGWVILTTVIAGDFVKSATSLQNQYTLRNTVMQIRSVSVMLYMHVITGFNTMTFILKAVSSEDQVPDVWVGMHFFLHCSWSESLWITDFWMSWISLLTSWCGSWEQHSEAESTRVSVLLQSSHSATYVTRV